MCSEKKTCIIEIPGMICCKNQGIGYKGNGHKIFPLSTNI
jgi:hypothetical protein